MTSRPLHCFFHRLGMTTTDARQRSSEFARALLARLEENHTSPTVLYYLRLPPTMLRHTELGTLLLDLCEDTRASVSGTVALDDNFFAEVTRAVRPMRCLRGAFFKVEKTKDGAIKSFREELLRRRAKCPSNRFLHMGASMPMCYQTLRGRSGAKSEHTDALFIVHSAAENALHMAVEMLQNGHYVFRGACVPVEQVYEMRLHDNFLTEGPSAAASVNRLGYIMLDWEIKESEVRGRLTREQLAALCAEFPLWFYQKMVERGHVARRAVVFATVKQKTRAIPDKGDMKHSIHVLFHVCGVPSTQLQHVCKDVLRDYWADLRKFKDKSPDVRATAFVDAQTGEDKIGDFPCVGADAAPLSGSTGIAMLFSRKVAADPYPGLEYSCAYSEGVVHLFPMRRDAFSVPNPCPFQPPAVDGQHRLESLTKDQAVHLMYMASCSVPKDNMVAPTQRSRENAEVQQSRTAARHQATSRVGGVAPPAHGGAGSAPVSSASILSVLPEWFSSYIGRMSGKERPTAAKPFAEQIRRLGISGADPSAWCVTHYHPGVPCPKMLSDPTPAIHHHSNNGVIVAVNGALEGVVFVRCTHCSCLSETNGDVERVRGRDHDQATNWIKLTEEGFKSVINKATKKTAQQARAEKMVKQKRMEHKQKEMEIQNAVDMKKKKQKIEMPKEL